MCLEARAKAVIELARTISLKEAADKAKERQVLAEGDNGQKITDRHFASDRNLALGLGYIGTEALHSITE
ncbi:MAG: hypothetical protein PUP92_00900 [Rhizonema sp. PD38]|nr:hypothetical protein [Rhizonema sp. PD38]